MDAFWATTLATTGPASTGEAPDVLTLVIGLLGGLALFLFGMDRVAEALKTVMGNRLKAILGRLTQNQVLGALTGAFVTAVIQSSSVTTVLVVGFITSGLMTLTQSIGIIMGANVGATVTAQIIAFRVTRYALLLVAVGFALSAFATKKRIRHYGTFLMGLGLVFYGMGVMGDAMGPLRGYEPVLDAMAHMEKPLLGILAGTLFTALIQSSAATTGIVIVMASQGLVTLPAGIALIFGANIGTCVTALLATIGKTREALRAAIVHVGFNVCGVLLWVAFIGQLAELVTWISPTAGDLQGAERLAAEMPRRIANAHTVFNVVNTLIFLGFASRIARWVEWLVPERPADEGTVVRARYLDPELLTTPSLALDRVRLEILHMGERVTEMMRAVLPAVFDGDEEELQRIAAMDDALDTLHGETVTYLGRISQGALTDEQTEELLRLMEATGSLENIGDIIETNLVALGRSRIRDGVTVSPATREVIEGFHRAVSRALDASLHAGTQKNEKAARLVVDMKREINRLADEAARHQAQRLVAEEPGRLEAYTFETDVLQNLKRIYYFTKRMARLTVPAVLEKGGRR